MRAFIEGFNQRVLIQLGFGPVEALLLQWFKSFSLSDRQKYIDRKAERYYWVKYSKVIADLPCLFIANEKKIGKLFAQLAGEGQTHPGQFPLKKIRANVGGVQQVYFKFNPGVLELLEGQSMFEELGTVGKKVKKNKRDHKLNQYVMTLLPKLKELKLEDGRDLFSFKLPEDEWHYTKSISRFGKMMMAIYHGRFKREYRIDPSFLERNSYYVGEENKTDLDAVELNWVGIEMMMVAAAQRYAKWFLPYNEPQKKEWLTRDISSWVYREDNQQSIFYLCLVNDPTSIKEVNAEKYYDKIPNVIKDRAEELFQEGWDGHDFWKRIWSLVKWYEDYASDLLLFHANTVYWLGDGIGPWFGYYVKWLNDSFPAVWLSNIGTDCATWQAYLKKVREIHDIEDVLPVK